MPWVAKRKAMRISSPGPSRLLAILFPHPALLGRGLPNPAESEFVMRFNQKELAFIATRTNLPFDKEGVLWLKEKEGYFWQRSDGFSERWFRLRGNILFYFKTKEKTSEPAGAIVLERCRVLSDKTSGNQKYGFTIVFDEDDSQRYHLCGQTPNDTDEWVEKIRNASYERLRNKLLSLRKQMMEVTGKDPLPEFHPLALQEPLKPGIGQYSSTSSADADESPFLEMCIACNNLVSAIEGTLPNAFVEIRTMSPPSTSWRKLAQTEIIEKKSDPYFLTTVVFPSDGTIGEMTRLKLTLFDVRNREKEEMLLLGQAVCTINDILAAPEQKLVLTLTPLDSPEECGTVTVLGWKVESRIGKSGREGEDGLGRRRDSSRTMVFVEHVLKRNYRFPTNTKREHSEVLEELKVLELMGESVLSFKIPVQFLKLLIAEEQRKILELHHLGDLNPNWENARQEIIDNHFKLICAYKGNLQELSALQGSFFKPARLRNDKKLAFVPINLHVQQMRVTGGKYTVGNVYDVITVGAPAAHTLKFSQGGLRKLLTSLSKAQQSGEGKNRATAVRQAMGNLEKFKITIKKLCQEVKRSINSANVTSLMDTMSNLSEKSNQLLKFRQTPLVKESLVSLEKAVPTTKEEPRGAPGADIHWNPKVFAGSDNPSCQELSTLVEQSLYMMQNHVTGMIQGSRSPEGQSWTEMIMSEVHDFSRAVDGLGKEIYLALIFLQLQEEAKHAGLLYDIRRRQDIVFSHAITALICGFVSKLYTSIDNPVFLKQLAHVGFLAQFESLLSTNGDEMGMLEDMCVGVSNLNCVKFKFKESEQEDQVPTLHGNRASIHVTVFLPTHLFRKLPRELREGVTVKVVPLIFTQGINEHATLAEKFGDTSLQEIINKDNYSVLDFYYQQFKGRFPDAVAPRVLTELSLDNLMKNLKSNIDSRRGKNVDILTTSGEICWRLNGCRFTSCKSAKDRTGMAVTLEQCYILKREHNMDVQYFQQALDAMRSEGTRRENTFKNTGVRSYAFNSWQVMALPKLYRPPDGTFGKSTQT